MSTGSIGSGMHAGLAAFAEEQSASRFKAFLAKAKALISNREGMKQTFGKQLVLARGFFAPTAFSKPATRDEWLVRMRHNFGHYRSLCARRATCMPASADLVAHVFLGLLRAFPQTASCLS